MLWTSPVSKYRRSKKRKKIELLSSINLTITVCFFYFFLACIFNLFVCILQRDHVHAISAVSMATPQWYQTPNIVTASIKLKGIPPDRLADITARSGEQYCAVCVGGESPDEPTQHSSLPSSLLFHIYIFFETSCTRVQVAGPVQTC